jgi:single-stranded DNA-binding protein
MMRPVNNVVLAGEIVDRPFRPGNGARTVIKLRVHDVLSGRYDRIEVDAFGQAGDFAMRLFFGDRVAVQGRLEDRTYRDGEDEVTELRVVANHIDLLVRSSDLKPRPDSSGSGHGHSAAAQSGSTASSATTQGSTAPASPPTSPPTSPPDTSA